MTNNVKKMYLPDIIGKGYGEFWKSKKRFRVLKGGRGSKKSKTVAIESIYRIMKYPLSNMVVVRKTGNTHKDSTFADLKWAAQRLGVYDLWKFTVSPLEAVYKPTGQVILFRGFDDPLKLTSLAVAKGYLCWAWIEEAYEIENEADFDTFDEGIRGKLPPHLWKQITLSYNPWINSHWTKDRFWDKVDPLADRFTTTHKCNEFMDKADHDKIEALAKTNPERYKVVGLGEYGIPGGAYFDEFRTDIHVIDPFVIPDWWQKFIALDYGLDMLACYWFAVDDKNKIYCYKELYKSGLIISEAAKEILNINNGENYKYIYAPPDLWNRRQETGKSASEIFMNNGVSMYKAKNDRVNGWYSVKEWLKPYATKDEQTGLEIVTSDLKIFKNCTNLIRTLPQLQCDDKNPNDVATEPHELTHAPDALRYFCGMRTAPSKPKEKSKLDLSEWEDEPEEYLGGEVSDSYLYGG